MFNMRFKLFVSLFSIGMLGIISASQFKDVWIELIQISLYSFFISWFMAPLCVGIKNRYSTSFYHNTYRNKITLIILTLTLVGIFIIVISKDLSIESFFFRNRENRELIFSQEKHNLVEYFIIFSSSFLVFYLGTISFLIKKKTLILAFLFMAFILDGVTDSRSNMLSAILAIMCSWFWFSDAGTKSYLIKIPTILIFTLFFLLIGQGDEKGILFLRVFSYFSAPVFLSGVVYSESDSLFIYSLLELFFWPIFTVMESPISHITSYEYEFYYLQNGLEMNVLIPIYSVLNNIGNTFFMLLIFILNYCIVTLTRNGRIRINGGALQLSMITIYGPLSMMINPFLAEKAFWLFIIILSLITIKFKSPSTI